MQSGSRGLILWCTRKKYIHVEDQDNPKIEGDWKRKSNSKWDTCHHWHRKMLGHNMEWRKYFNEKAESIKNVQTDNAKIQEQQWSDISVKDLQTALKQSRKWKSAGIDQVSRLNALCKGYCIRDTVKNPKYSPAWLSEGITYLLPKTNDTVNPNNCRPIIWLSTTYKLPTLVITERMHVFMEANDLFPIKQKGCKRESYE